MSLRVAHQDFKKGGSAAKELGFKRWRPDHGLATDKYEKDLERWEKLLKEISRRGR